jgi:hypothetical protein
LFVKPTSGFPLAPVFSIVCFSGFNNSACPDPEPACRSVPYGLWSGLLTSACPWPVVLPHALVINFWQENMIVF